MSDDIITTTLTVVTTGDHALVSTPGAGKYLTLFTLGASNTSATEVIVTFKEGSGFARWSMKLAPTGGGFVLDLSEPWKLPLDTGLHVEIDVAVTDVRFSCRTSVTGLG